MEYLIENINNYTDKYLDEFLKRIPIRKQATISKYRTATRRKQAIIGEILLSQLLKKFNVDYNSINITFNENGKPYIKNSLLYYNISHSNEFVMCAVSEKELGVDIEKIRPFDSRIMDKIITKEDHVVLGGISPKNVLQIYVRKEAYIKAYGYSINEIKNAKFYDDDKIKFQIIEGTQFIAAICEKK